jgi:hypothetical protein
MQAVGRKYNFLMLRVAVNLKVYDTEDIHWNNSHHDIVSDSCTELSTNVLKV